MTYPDESAHPSGDHNQTEPFRGMTKREAFAMAAMQGLLANSIYHNPDKKHRMVSVPALAETACTYADALIEALNKTK